MIEYIDTNNSEHRVQAPARLVAAAFLCAYFPNEIFANAENDEKSIKLKENAQKMLIVYERLLHVLTSAKIYRDVPMELVVSYKNRMNEYLTDFRGM
jgi:hypothetical protein